MLETEASPYIGYAGLSLLGEARAAATSAGLPYHIAINLPAVLHSVHPIYSASSNAPASFIAASHG